MSLACCLSYGFYSLKQAQRVKRIQFDPQLGWQISLEDSLESAVLLGDSTVTRYVSVLRFKVAKRKYSSVLFKHNIVGYVPLLRLLMTLKMSGKLNPINDRPPAACGSHQWPQR